MMFKIFKTKKAIAAPNPLQDKAAAWVVVKLLRLQNKWAMYMDRRVNPLSVRSKKFGLIVFVGLSLLVCISILIETFTKGHHKSSFQIGQLRKQVLQYDEVDQPFNPPRQYKKIVAFHKYMDSLSATVPGRKIFDSINQCRPGLMDSVKQLETLYQSQNK